MTGDGGLLEANESDHTAWVFGKMLIGLAMMIGLPIVVVQGANHVRQGLASHQWPMVEGTVIRATTEQVQRRRQLPHHRVKVQYSYNVEGKNHSGDQMVGDEVTTLESLAPVLQQYPPGGKLPVYYDPAKPDYSLLQRGGNWFWSLVGAVLFGILALLGAVTAWQNAMLLKSRVESPKRSSSRKKRTSGVKKKRRPIQPVDVDEDE